MLVGHPQGDAQVRVRPQVVLDDAGRALGREDEVQPERAATLGDVDDPVDELGDLLGQGGELVHHDHQGGGCLRVADALEREQVLGLLAVEEVLATTQLRAERGQRPPHQVRREVGHETHRVREVHAVREGRAALVVDEEEGDPVRAVGRGHPEHPRLEELALARTRRAADEGVRTLRAQVEHELAVRALTHQGTQGRVVLTTDPQPARAIDERAGLAPPLDDRRRVGRDLRTREREVGDRARDVGLVQDGSAGVHDGGEAPAELSGDPQVERLAQHLGPCAVRHEADTRGRAGDRGDEHAAHRGQLLDPARAPQDVDPGRGTLLGKAHEPAALDRGVVLDDQHDRRDGPLRTAPGGAAGRDELLEPRDQREAGRRARREMVPAERAVRRGDVREPLEPVPAGAALARRDRRQDELGRRVHAHELGHEPARDVVDEVTVAGHTDGARSAQVDEDGHPGHVGEAVADTLELGPELRDGLAARRHRQRRA